ncbi:MAG: hypothetical protein OEW83_03585 [Acidimicrobiia bacterium]|nr:hypothetical protein [Acidimicrobiia bacterium]
MTLEDRLNDHYRTADRSMPVPAAGPESAHRRARRRQRNTRLVTAAAGALVLAGGWTAVSRTLLDGSKATITATDDGVTGDRGADAARGDTAPGFDLAPLDWDDLGVAPFDIPTATVWTGNRYLAYSPYGDQPGLWSSHDGTAWTSLGMPFADGEVPVGAGMWADGEGAVFLWSSDGGAPAALLESHDGGADFIPVEVPKAVFNPTSLLLTNQRRIAGVVERDGTVVMAIAEVPEMDPRSVVESLDREDLTAWFNEGVSTRLTTDGLEFTRADGSESIVVGFGELGLDATDTQFAATGRGTGWLYRRTDGDPSFENTGLGDLVPTTVAVSGDAFVVAGARLEGPPALVTRSIDGAVWIDVAVPDDVVNVTAGPQGSLLGHRALVTPTILADLGTARSVDGGATWSEATGASFDGFSLGAGRTGVMAAVDRSGTGEPIVITKGDYTVSYTEAQVTVVDRNGQTVIDLGAGDEPAGIMSEDLDTGTQTFYEPASGDQLLTITLDDVMTAAGPAGFDTPYSDLVWSWDGKRWGTMATADAWSVDAAEIGRVEFAPGEGEVLAFVKSGNENAGYDGATTVHRASAGS